VPEDSEAAMAARVREILNRHPAVGLAVGVVRNGSLEFFHGHGVADIASHRPITKDTVFRIASVTKTFTAIATMQLSEQGLLDLDAPANDYLRAFKLIPTKASFRPASVRHLLTHTAGVPEQAHPVRMFLPFDGEYIKCGQPLPTLAEYYRAGLHQTAEPGTRFAYGNHSFATLGQIVEDVSGLPLDRYFHEHIFTPLGMDDTDLLRSERVRSRLATGYSLSPNGPQKVTDGETVTGAAGGIYSTPRDMARYLAALLGGGSNELGSILKPATMAAMFEPHYQPDPRVSGVGLAFVRTDLGGHLVVGHKGILPGFNSQIWVAPDDDVGVMAFTNGAREAVSWLPGEVAGLLRLQLGVPDDIIRTDIPQRPDLWGDLCGWYALSALLTDLELRSAVGAGFEVFVRHGELILRGLSPIPAMVQGFPLHPDDTTDPDVFRIDLSHLDMGTSRVAFRRDAAGTVRGLHLDLSPVTLNKRPAASNPRLWVSGALGGLALGSAAGVARRQGMRAHQEATGVR
jgi:CubicO group peptidase (beta-lactamase class C family)